jgi:hypothetical protein
MSTEFQAEIRYTVQRISIPDTSGSVTSGFLIDGFFISDDVLHAGHQYSLLVTAMISAPQIILDGGVVCRNLHIKAMRGGFFGTVLFFNDRKMEDFSLLLEDIQMCQSVGPADPILEILRRACSKAEHVLNQQILLPRICIPADIDCTTPQGVITVIKAYLSSASPKVMTIDEYVDSEVAPKNATT